MSRALPQGELVAEVERLLAQGCGLTLSSERRRSLGGALARAAGAERVSPEDFLVRLRANEPGAVSALLESITLEGSAASRVARNRPRRSPRRS